MCRLVSKYAGRKGIINEPRISYWTLSYKQAISNLRAYEKETDVCIVWSVLVSNRILQIVFVDQIFRIF